MILSKPHNTPNKVKTPKPVETAKKPKPRHPRGRAPASPFRSDGVWVCFSDLTAAMVGPLFADGNSGSGLCLLLCPGEPPRRGAPGRAPAGWLLYDGHVIAQSRPVAPRAHA